jgi:hypothetical protein
MTSTTTPPLTHRGIPVGAPERSRKALGDILEKRGYPADKAAKGQRVRRGLTLLADDDAGKGSV